jgi:MSHA biogenesis protein MshE
LARQLRVPVVNLKSFPLKSETVRLLPESPARRHRALVLDDKGNACVVAAGDSLRNAPPAKPAGQNL